MTAYNEINRPKKACVTGSKDVQNTPIREGDVLINKNNHMALLVVYSEFTDKFGLIPLCCFKDMARHPNTRTDYLGDIKGISPDIIDFWQLTKVGNIDTDSRLINNSSLFLVS